jgi:hypothetical protein
MKGLFGWIGKSNGATQAVEVQPQSRITIADVEKLLRCFPIGVRLKYYPEYSESVKFDTLILAYVFDETLVYSNNSISFPKGEGESEILLATEGGEQRISNLDGFHFLVPRITRIELDYKGDEEVSAQKPINDFARGNTITLVNKMLNGKVPQIDTTVTRVTVLADGCYAKRQVAYLQPSPETFAMSDKREFVRIYVNIPARLYETPESESHACTILDYSEGFLRVDLAAHDPLWDNLSKKSQIFISVDLQLQSQIIMMQASVRRIQGDQVLLALTHILKGQQFKELDSIDKLELKASIFDHLAIQKPCSKES